MVLQELSPAVLSLVTPNCQERIFFLPSVMKKKIISVGGHGIMSANEGYSMDQYDEKKGTKNLKRI